MLTTVESGLEGTAGRLQSSLCPLVCQCRSNNTVAGVGVGLGVCDVVVVLSDGGSGPCQRYGGDGSATSPYQLQNGEKRSPNNFRSGCEGNRPGGGRGARGEGVVSSTSHNVVR